MTETHAPTTTNDFYSCFEYEDFRSCFGEGAMESYELHDGGTPEEKCKAYDIMLFNALDCIGELCLPHVYVSCEEFGSTFQFFITGVENCTEDFDFYANCSASFLEALEKIHGVGWSHFVCFGALIVALIVNNLS